MSADTVRSDVSSVRTILHHKPNMLDLRFEFERTRSESDSRSSMQPIQSDGGESAWITEAPSSPQLVQSESSAWMTVATSSPQPMQSEDSAWITETAASSPQLTRSEAGDSAWVTEDGSLRFSGSGSLRRVT